MRPDMISSILATWVSVAAAIGGGYIALDNYLEDSKKRLDQRQMQTFEMVKTFASTDMVPIRDKVLRLVQSRLVCGSETMQSVGLSETELFTFVEYFDLVAACSEAQLCDPKLVERFFSPYANVHWPVLTDYVRSVRRGEEAMKLERPFGFGLESLATIPRPLQGC